MTFAARTRYESKATLTAFAVALCALLAGSAVSAQTIDINEADADTLSSLPGLGKTTAKAIVKYRTDNGPFKSASELLKVKGVGKKTLAKFEEQLAFGGVEDEGAPSPDGGENANAAGGSSLKRGNSMEFDGRLIRGETAGAGAVFLFERVPRPLPSMVKKRTTYLDDSVAAVYGLEEDLYEEADEAEPETRAKKKADAPGKKMRKPAAKTPKKKKGKRTGKMRRRSRKGKR